MLRLADDWIWDFWLADDGTRFHLFMLKAPRAIGDPDARHWNQTIGHAVSDDLVHWTELGDALSVGATPAFDDRSTWTGSVVANEGRWWMFYTATSNAERGLKQRIGLATSDDLTTWIKHRRQPLVESDPRWYESVDDTQWPDEAWRDPWVFRAPDDSWHMLVTARARTGPHDDRGVIGHARSHDLVDWEVLAPLSRPGAGFGQLEVPQLAVVNGRGVLLFSCLGAQLARRSEPRDGGVWCVPVDSDLGPFPVERARRLTDETLYSGRLTQNRAGDWLLLAFRNVACADDGSTVFLGELSDPLPVRWSTDGTTLVVDR